MFELRATTREAGKKLGTMRNAGEVPAILYGPGVEPLSIAISRQNFERAFAEAGESSLLRLVIDDSEGKGTHVVLIRDIQRDPIRGKPLHLDFHAVRLNEEITLKVPLDFAGQSPIEARGEGVVVKDLHELEIEALPEKLPHDIRIEISRLDTIESEIRVRDLVLPDGVRAVSDPDLVVVHVAPPMSEEEVSAIEKSTEEGVSEIEVIGAKKEEVAEEMDEGAAAAKKSEES